MIDNVEMFNSEFERVNVNTKLLVKHNCNWEGLLDIIYPEGIVSLLVNRYENKHVVK